MLSDTLQEDIYLTVSLRKAIILKDLFFFFFFFEAQELFCMAFLKASEGDVINKNGKMVGKTFTLLVLQRQTGRLSNRVTQLHYGYVIGQHFHYFFFVVEVSIVLHNLTADS